MTRTWTILAIVAAALVVIGGGKFVGMVVLAALMPVYSLLLASVALIIFLALSAVIVPIGQNYLDKSESRFEAEELAEETRRAA